MADWCSRQFGVHGFRLSRCRARPERPLGIMRLLLFTVSDEQSLAQMEREVTLAFLRSKERLHLGRGLGQHGLEQRLHNGVVAARPAAKLDRFRAGFLVPDGKAVARECRT